MICQILPAALLSLSFSLVGCAVYDVDSPRYSSSRYPHNGQQQSSYTIARSGYGYQNYGYQQPSSPVVRYREYPAPVYRYPQRVQPVYIYRQAPPRYRAAPGWQGYRAAPGWQGYRDSGRDGRYDRQQDRREYQYQRDEGQHRDRDEHRGWEVRLN